MAEYPQRKRPRLSDYDYSSAGAYYVTICTEKKKYLLSEVTGEGTEFAEIKLSNYGAAAERQLMLMEKRYSFLKIDQYIIMPNHIHVIFSFEDAAPDNCSRPSLMDIICAYKSLTTKRCRELGLRGKLFQTSFYEHIIRGAKDYEVCAGYIRENPLRWQLDELYSGK